MEKTNDFQMEITSLIEKAEYFKYILEVINVDIINRIEDIQNVKSDILPPNLFSIFISKNSLFLPTREVMQNI
jgi:hypothetical protein